MMEFSLARYVPHLGRLGRATRWRRSKLRPRVWAHRGDSAHAPENTMVAFEKAKAADADGIELDVRFDGDHNVVVFHDVTLDRLTGETGEIEQVSTAQRKRLRVGGEPIPLLADVLDAFDIEVDVEIKAPRPGRMGALVAATAKVIEDSGRMDQVLVSSFDPLSLIQFHRHLPEVALAYLFHDEQSLPLRKGWLGRWMGASLFHPQSTLCTEATMRAWRDRGVPVNAWTVDEASELLRLSALGVDGVFCNDPGHAVRVLSRG
ncbi:MAG: glycerophosphodiester phosphodiesterase [Kofleriaceae bacterium]